MRPIHGWGLDAAIPRVWLRTQLNGSPKPESFRTGNNRMERGKMRGAVYRASCLVRIRITLRRN
jgi:hypothetical protein